MEINGVKLEELEEFLKKADDKSLKNWNKLVEERLLSTKDALERNDLALILADHWGDLAVKPIIRLLEDDKTEGNRGTLLYALGDLDYSMYLDILIDLMIQGNFEVSREAFSLIEKVVKSEENSVFFSEERIAKYKSELEQKIEYLNEETEFYEDALELLTNKLEE